MKKLIFIKLGGSLITEKDKPMTARLEIINQLAKDISELVNNMPEYTFVIGNGAGSFGHYQVVKYGLKDGFTDKKALIGVAEVQAAVAQLNSLVCDELLKKGVPVLSIKPSTMFTAKDAHLFNSAEAVFIQSLRAGLVPSVYGDIILDVNKGCTIFSTETIFDILISIALKEGFVVESVIHLTKVPGVLDASGKVIPEITNKNWTDVQKHISATNGFDVTGGMKHKIEFSLQYAAKGIVTYIGNGEEKGILQRVLLNEDSSSLTKVSG